MDQYFNLDAARAAYSDKENGDLIRIAFFDNETYRKEAIELARSELSQRGINSESHISVDDERAILAQEKAIDNARAKEPLGLFLKIICFIFPGIIGLIIAITRGISGKHQASREAWKYIGYGWLSRFALIFVYYAFN